jgi:uncharacterized protein GlcG (DUF336 family)
VTKSNSSSLSNKNRSIRNLQFLGLSLSLLFSSSALANTLSLESAQKAAQATLNKCLEDGHKVSVAVVDRGGNLIVQLRADGAGPHTLDSSRRKAYTAASMGRSTMELSELLVKVPRIAGLRDMNESILILGGGLPIKQNQQVVAGIGVGGAPGDKLDEACAQAGLDALEAKK